MHLTLFWENIQTKIWCVEPSKILFSTVFVMGYFLKYINYINTMIFREYVSSMLCVG